MYLSAPLECPHLSAAQACEALLEENTAQTKQ